jgi:hypothetical protein
MPDTNTFSFSVGTGKENSVLLKKEWPAGGYLEIGASHFSLNSAVFLPNDSERIIPDESEDIYSSGIVMLERAIHFLELTTKKLLIAGHTDTKGDLGSNVTLSKYRAQAVYSSLIGDRELFKTVSNAPHIHDNEKKHNTLLKDKLQIADWSSKEYNWPCTLEENNNDYIKIFKAFQQSYNNNINSLNPNGELLAVDGGWGPKTWGAAFDCYQYKLAQRLTIDRKDLDSYRDKMKLTSKFAFSDHHFIACGEYHPIDRPGEDDLASKKNRRVEMIFFDDDAIPELSCLEKGCSFNGCTLFDSLDPVRGRIIHPHWEYPLVLAGHTENRKMFVRHLGSEPGEDAEFTIMQICNGEMKKILSPVKSKLVVGLAIADFEELSPDVISQIDENNKENYLSYFFTVKGNNWMTVSARLHSEKDGSIYE